MLSRIRRYHIADSGDYCTICESPAITFQANLNEIVDMKNTDDTKLYCFYELRSNRNETQTVRADSRRNLFLLGWSSLQIRTLHHMGCGKGIGGVQNPHRRLRHLRDHRLLLRLPLQNRFSCLGCVGRLYSRDRSPAYLTPLALLLLRTPTVLLLNLSMLATSKIAN